jgi:hypothetical protein
MAKIKTKLTQALREQIATGITSHTFKSRGDASKILEQRFFIECAYDVFGIENMENVNAHVMRMQWFEPTNRLYITAGSYRLRLQGAEPLYFPAYSPRDGEPLPSSHRITDKELIQRLQAWSNAYKDRDERRSQFYSELLCILRSTPTVEAFLALMPEAKPFIPFIPEPTSTALTVTAANIIRQMKELDA